MRTGLVSILSVPVNGLDVNVNGAKVRSGTAVQARLRAAVRNTNGTSLRANG
jgi:hypothetical protein